MHKNFLQFVDDQENAEKEAEEGGPPTDGIIMQSNQAVQKSQNQQIANIEGSQSSSSVVQKIKGMFNKSSKLDSEIGQKLQEAESNKSQMPQVDLFGQKVDSAIKTNQVIEMNDRDQIIKQRQDNNGSPVSGGDNSQKQQKRLRENIKNYKKSI